MSASAFESPQHPSRGKRSVSFSCPTPLRPASTASTPLTRSATFGSSSQSPIHSRSLSWNTVSTSSTEGRGDKVVAWEDGDDEGDFLAGSPIRWNKALAERLELVERELKHHQKKWSAGQEDFHHELEHLLELKRDFKRFTRRRTKDQKAEGKRFSGASSLVTSDAEVEVESELDVPQRGIGAALKRRISAPFAFQTSDEDEVEQIPTATPSQPPTKPRLSLIKRVMSSKDTTDSNESSASSRPRRANSSSAKMAMTSSAGKSDTESDYRPAMQSQGKRKGGKSKRNAGGPFGGLLRRVTFPRGGGKGG